MEEASSIEQLSKNACFLHGFLEVLQPLKSAPIMSKIGGVSPQNDPKSCENLVSCTSIFIHYQCS